MCYSSGSCVTPVKATCQLENCPIQLFRLVPSRRGRVAAVGSPWRVSAVSAHTATPSATSFVRRCRRGVPGTRNLQGALTGRSRGRNTGYSRDSGSNCYAGSRHQSQADLCANAAARLYLVSSMRGSISRRVNNCYDNSVEHRPGREHQLAGVDARRPFHMFEHRKSRLVDAGRNHRAR